MKHKKRFVAGAVCPACNQKDTVRIWLENSVSYRDCVVCDFYESNQIEENSQSQNLAQNGEINWSSKEKLINITDATNS